METNGPKTVRVNDNNDLKFRTGLSNETPKTYGIKRLDESTPGVYNVNEKKDTKEDGALEYITE